MGEEETVRVEWPVKVETIQDSDKDDHGNGANGSGGAASFVRPPPLPAVSPLSPAVSLFGGDGPAPTLSRPVRKRTVFNVEEDAVPEVDG